MQKLAAMIGRRCDSFNTINGFDPEVKERDLALRTLKAEVRWLVRQYTSINCEVDFGSSNDREVNVKIIFPECEGIVTMRSTFFGIKSDFSLGGASFKVSDETAKEVQRVKPKEGTLTMMLQLAKELNTDVSDVVPNNLVEA